MSSPCPPEFVVMTIVSPWVHAKAVSTPSSDVMRSAPAVPSTRLRKRSVPSVPSRREPKNEFRPVPPGEDGGEAVGFGHGRPTYVMDRKARGERRGGLQDGQHDDRLPAKEGLGAKHPGRRLDQGPGPEMLVDEGEEGGICVGRRLGEEDRVRIEVARGQFLRRLGIDEGAGDRAALRFETVAHAGGGGNSLAQCGAGTVTYLFIVSSRKTRLSAGLEPLPSW